MLPFISPKATLPNCRCFSLIITYPSRGASRLFSSQSQNGDGGVTLESLRGMNDVLSASCEKRSFIAESAENVAKVRLFQSISIATVVEQLRQSYGYKEIQTPLLEKTNLFARSLGDDTDVVSKVRMKMCFLSDSMLMFGVKEMYTFDDKSGNSVSLRPENTAGSNFSFGSVYVVNLLLSRCRSRIFESASRSNDLTPKVLLSRAYV